MPREPPVTSATLPVSGLIAPLEYSTGFMTTVCIIGAGDIGGASCAGAGARRSRRRVCCSSTPPARSRRARRSTFSSRAPSIGFHVRLDGTDDVSRVAGCAAVIVADRFGRPSAEWQGDDGLALMARLASVRERGADRVRRCACRPSCCEPRRAKRTSLRERLVGSAPEALVAAVRAIVAMEARCSPSEVDLTVLGAPPSGFVVPWSEASIGGYSLERVLSQVQLARLEARAARLWPPGPFALGLAAARVTEALVRHSRRAFSVLTVLGGEFGVRGRVGAMPVNPVTDGNRPYPRAYPQYT